MSEHADYDKQPNESRPTQHMKTQYTASALAVATALSLSVVLGMPAVDGPAPTMAARQDSNAYGGQAIVDGTTLTTGLNTIGAQTYTYTDGYVLGPTITQGPSLQINPSVTQAFGCQIVDGGTQQGNCDNIQAKISSALASVTSGGSQTVAASATSSSSSSSAQQTSGSSSSTDAAPTPLHVHKWTLVCAAVVGSFLAVLM